MKIDHTRTIEIYNSIELGRNSYGDSHTYRIDCSYRGVALLNLRYDVKKGCSVGILCNP